MIGPTDKTYTLSEGVELIAPFALKMQLQDGLSSGFDPHALVKLTFFCKPGAKGATTEQILASVIATLQKRHPALQSLAPMEASNGHGWTGHSMMLRQQAPHTPLRIIVTSLVLPAAADTQRNIGLILEMPEATFVDRPVYFRRFAEQRLRMVSSIETQAVAPSSAWSLVEQEQSQAASDQTAASPITAAESLRASTASSPTLAPPERDGVQRKSAAKIAEEEAEHAELEQLQRGARGQKSVIYSIALTFVLNAMARNPEFPPALFVLLGVLLTLYACNGVLKMAGALQLQRFGKLACMFLSSVPLLNLITWIVLSTKTTRKLRNAGYEVGLFGVRS